MVLCYHLEGKAQIVAESTVASEEITEAQTGASNFGDETVSKQKTKQKNKQKTKEKLRSNPKPPASSQAATAAAAPTPESSSKAIINIPETIKPAPTRKEPIRAFPNGPGVETTADPNAVGPGIPKIRPEVE